MNIKFKHIIFDNFLSFKHAEIDLGVSGYTFIKGINNNPNDLAISNGSGKSTVFEALSWCITGETVRGTKDVKRLNAEDKECCSVTLDFSVDNHNYTICRQSSPSKLYLTVDGVDVSGKGIRDTEIKLKEYLPDLTSSLIGSVVVLGQGLPMRFSNNSPSGRKEVLEKLSKSDFMIQDLRTRISNRKKTLDEKIRSQEDELLKLNTQKDMLNSSINNFKAELAALEAESIDSIKEQLNKEKIEKSEYETSLAQLEHELETKKAAQISLLEQKTTLTNDMNNAVNEVCIPFDSQLSDLIIETTAIKTQVDLLNSEIKRLENIKDVCPTCGQKLPGIEKPSTDTQKQQVAELTAKYNELKDKSATISNSKNSAVIDIKNKFDAQISKIVESYNKVTSEISDYNNKIASTRNHIKVVEKLIDDFTMAVDDYEHHKRRLKDDINTNERSIETLNTKILYINNEKDNTQEHLDVIQKMNTVITRDFRGYLLTSVIDFINKKAKEYSLEVFETDKIDFCLNGNNIDISYDGKDYYNLSGGERQKVDLIVQFSIRDMLCKYLNFSSNILVLDEITDFLDVEGSTRVVNLITNKLSDVESIYIISHHTELNIPCDNEIVVVKDTFGISSLK